MAKRLFDTDKFIDPWYRRLSTNNKLLWDWLLCSCDHAGIIEIDLEFIEMVLKEKFDDDVIITDFKERVIPLPNGKYFIPKFIKFQYGKLNPSSKVHSSVMVKLEENGIRFNDLSLIKSPENDAQFIGYGKGIDRDIVNVKDKNNKNINNINLNSVESNNSSDTQRITIDKLIQLYNDTLAGIGKLKHCRGLGPNSLKSALNTFSRFPNTEAWVEIFNVVKSNSTLNGNSKTVFLATLDWLVIEDNALKVLNGKYDTPTQTESKESEIDSYLKTINLG